MNVQWKDMTSVYMLVSLPLFTWLLLMLLPLHHSANGKG